LTSTPLFFSLFLTSDFPPFRTFPQTTTAAAYSATWAWRSGPRRKKKKKKEEGEKGTAAEKTTEWKRTTMTK